MSVMLLCLSHEVEVVQYACQRESNQAQNMQQTAETLTKMPIKCTKRIAAMCALSLFLSEVCHVIKSATTVTF